MYIPSQFIPENDISIKPKKVYIMIKDLLNREIDFYDNNKDFVILLNSVKKNMLNEFSKRYIWQTELASDKTCEHLFGEKSRKHGEMCGRRIDIKAEKENTQYRCSMHIDNKYKPKSRIIDPKDLCKGIKKNGDSCSMKGIHKGYCIYHNGQNKIKKLQKKVNKIEQDNIIRDIKEITKKSVNIKSFDIVEELKIKPFINELEIKNNEYTDVDKLKKDEIDKINNKLINLNININNFKYKLEIINEIFNIKPNCRNKYCNNINTIRIIKSLYCKNHAEIALNNQNYL